ncbi:MAG TPA: hypothetical protein ENK92_01150, partial [Bacteroidetes bacterium]|nr:hypothetical protein [Bacteroidota bacterium]
MPSLILKLRRGAAKRTAPFSPYYNDGAFQFLRSWTYDLNADSDFKLKNPAVYETEVGVLLTPILTEDLVRLSDQIEVKEWNHQQQGLTTDFSGTPFQPLSDETINLAVQLLAPTTTIHDLSVLEVEVTENLFKPLGKLNIDGKCKAVKNPTDDLPEESLFDGPKERLQKIRQKREARELEKALKRDSRLLGKGESLDFWEIYIFPLLDPPLDLNFPSIVLRNQKLYDFQIEGIKYLVTNPNYLLADTMGLGKTIQVIVAIRILFQQGKICNGLIICPRGIVYQWEEEFEKWAPALEVLVVYGNPADREACWRREKHVYITSYDSLRRDCGEYPRPPGRTKFDLIVV